MMRPDAALARPARTALSVVNASSGRSLSLTFCRTAEQGISHSRCLVLRQASRLAETSAAHLVQDNRVVHLLLSQSCSEVRQAPQWNDGHRMPGM